MGLIASIGDKIKTILQSVICPNQNGKPNNTNKSSTLIPLYEKTNEDNLQKYEPMMLGANNKEGTSLFKEKIKDAKFNIQKVLGKAVEHFSKDTKDGIITNSRQFNTGDCWLLSGVNALSYTDKGKEIIKNALKYYEDGSIEVNFKGLDRTYTITKDEITATKGTLQYSFGDDDMIALELAVEKARDDIANNKIVIDSCAKPEFFNSDITSTTLFKSSTESGFPNELFFYMTGIIGENIPKGKQEDQAVILDKFQENNNKDFVMAASTDKGKFVREADGSLVHLRKSHAYSIKSVDSDTVTITNPWNSKKDIVLPRKTFMENFSIDYCDLSNNKINQDFIGKTYTEDENGYKTYRFEHKEPPLLDDYGVSYEITEEIYSPDGTKYQTILQNKSDKTKKIINYYPNGKMKDYTYYDKNGYIEESIEYDKKGRPKKKIRYDLAGNPSRIIEYDKKGNEIQ